MRLYRFQKTSPSIDVIMVTDGIGDIENVMITESLRGKDSDIFELEKLGTNFIPGSIINEKELILFALNNKLKLTRTDEGMKSNDLILTQESMSFEYTLTVDPSSMSFPKEGGSKTFSYISTKKVTTEGPLKDKIYPVDVTTSITEDSAGMFSVEGNIVTAKQATENEQKTGKLHIVQKEGSKTIDCSLTLAATGV